MSFEGAMVSYAGCGEDVVLRRYLRDQPVGFYTDVGAHDPVLGSVTHHFSRGGWTGINIEPLPTLFDRLVLLRPDDLNLNIAAPVKPRTLDLVWNRTEPGLSTFTEELAERYGRAGHALERISVRTERLADIVRSHCADRTVDLLESDVEGHELAVLEGAEFTT